MNLHSPETIGLLLYGFGCAMLALSSGVAGAARGRIHGRNFWLCALHGLLQGGGGLVCPLFAAGEGAHVGATAAGLYFFYLFALLTLWDFVLVRRWHRWWRPALAILPWAGLPWALAAADPVAGLQRLALGGLAIPGALLAAWFYGRAFIQAGGPERRPRLYRLAVLNNAGMLVLFAGLNLCDPVWFPAAAAPLWLAPLMPAVGAGRGLCLLLGAAGGALLLRQLNRETQAREHRASAALAALNATLEDRVRVRTEALLETNTELEDSIARHNRTEEELRASTARLQALFDQPAMGVTFLDTECRYLRVNRCFAALVGRTPEELVGRNFAEISEAPEVAQDMALWGEILADRRPFFVREKSYVRPDGGRVWVTVYIVVVRDAQQRISHLIGLYEDIGERKHTAEALRENERRLQLALAAAQQSLFEFHVPERRFHFAADYAGRLGYRPGEFPAEHARWTEYVHAEDRPAALGALRACLDGQATTLQTEFRQRTASGSWLWIVARGSVVARDEAGRPLRLLGTLTDVTERRALDERLRRTERLESIGSLAGGIAHDLNNALVPLLAGVSFLREYVPPEEADLVAAMETSSRRAAGMVQQLLVFARGAEGRRTPVQPAALIGEMRRFIESTFPPNVQLQVTCLSKAAVVLGDPTQLHQVLLNLCVNARDAMPRGGALGLEARLVEVDAALAAAHDGARPGPHVVFVVSDSGTGIPVAVRERIFDPFFTTKGPEKGTGLGLSTVLGIVRGHGGFIELHTEEGKGTRFLIHLPVAGEGAAAATGDAAAPKLPEGRGRRLLVVDDEEIVRTLIQRVFEGSGFELVCAQDGIEGLAWTNTPGERIDLMLLDMTMPNLGGLEVLRRLRAGGRMVPTLAMSGNFDREQQAALRELGVAQLAKPFQRDELIRAVRQVLQLDA